MDSASSTAGDALLCPKRGKKGMPIVGGSMTEIDMSDVTAKAQGGGDPMGNVPTPA
jgi:hypothetical protein